MLRVWTILKKHESECLFSRSFLFKSSSPHNAKDELKHFEFVYRWANRGGAVIYNLCTQSSKTSSWFERLGRYKCYPKKLEFLSWDLYIVSMGFFWLFNMSQLSCFVTILSFSLYSVFTFLVSFYSRSVSSPFIFFSQIGVRYKSSMVTLIYIRSLFFHSCSVSFKIVVRPLPFLSIHR